MVSEINDKEKKLRRHFCELSDELLNRTESVYIAFIVYMFCTRILYLCILEKTVKNKHAQGGITNK